MEDDLLEGSEEIPTVDWDSIEDTWKWGEVNDREDAHHRR